ncbi:UvrD-helicase domain-containing protein [Erwinia sp. PsM31]|uniref:UvrD-helicase domain-containing protein n=1 Tax=Erwinia sp. PsM31 TaxID=3030535 RepID=UPI00263B0316|nr:ATP-dependent helicase [Erwinia sp. PsM31]MDN4626584.1 ATP-dependent helicase [Erwinia sp. PsM31]
MITVEEWQPADGLTLEPNAKRAAKARKRCLALTAGPGAGKTEMLAQRADFLLRTGTCRYPKRILAISFKVDASKNLKERVERRCGRDLASRFDSYTFHGFAKRIIDRFRPILTGKYALNAGYAVVDKKNKPSHNEIEYSEMVPYAIKILQTSKIARNAIRQTYSDIFLDEFQDCTNLQYDLVKLAFRGTRIRLTAVGDTKQKIMGWAGALDGIFKSFTKDFNAVPLNMYRNFRSKPTLLRVQNEIIRKLDPDSVMPDEQIEGDEGEVFAWEFADSQTEAIYLAELINGWINTEKLPPAEIAVLISKQPDLYADHLFRELEQRGIPYRNEQQVQDITVEPVARLIVDYLSCLFGQREPKAWIRLMNQLLPFADEETQTSARKDLDQLIRKHRKEVSDAKKTDTPFSEWWKFGRAFLKHVGFQTLVALSSDYESHERLKQVIRDAKARIKDFLEIESDLPLALKRFTDDQAVRILTIHKSKGLEFDSVVIMAVENEIFFGNEEDNRCAFFVGVSRAKRRLILTHTNKRDEPANARHWKVFRTARLEYFDYVLPFVR